MQTPAVPRLAQTVDLHLPAADLEREILRWACQQGTGAFFTTDQLRKLRAKLEAQLPRTEAARHLVMDIDIGLGALSARIRQPSGGAAAYVTAWETLLLSKGLGQGTEIDQLRALHDRFGGILLNGRAAPFVLLIPCEDRTWLQIGWNLFTHLADNPLTNPKPAAIAVHEGLAAPAR